MGVTINRYRRIDMKNIIKKVLLPMILAFVLVVPCFSAFAADNLTPAVLEIAGFESREIISYSYSFDRATDDKNEPAGSPQMATVKIRVKATADGNNQLQQWMLAKSDARDAKILVFSKIDGSMSKKIEMTDATCVKHNLVYGDAKYGDYEDIEVVCATLSNGPIRFNNSDVLTGTTVSNSNNSVLIICCSAAAIVIVAAVAIIVVKKKNKK